MDDSNIIFTIQSASQGWLTFDWDGKRAAVDATLTQAKEAREQSLTARKQLSESTKQFKRAVKTVEQASNELTENVTTESIQATAKAVEALSNKARSTVKSFQEEVDALTRRCKAAETSYGHLTSQLLELPDPSTVIGICMEQLAAQQAQMTQLLQTVDQVNQELQLSEKANANYKKEISTLKQAAAAAGAEVPASGGLLASAAASVSLGGSSGSALSKEDREELVQLRREVAEYEVEFRSLKNQDITIRKLEAKIAEMQSDAETQMKDQLEKIKEELQETEGRRAAEALEREAAMERKVESLQLQLKAERAGFAATQAHILETDEGLSQREAAWEAQRQILVDDAERMREALQAAARERDELSLRVAALQGNQNKSPPPSGSYNVKDLMLERKAYEAEVSELSETAAMLREELRLKDECIGGERRDFLTRIGELERETANLQATVTSLEAQLASAPSLAVVESMKRELRILKRLEYNAQDVDAERDPEMTGFNEDEGKDLESVFVAKLRRAESELVTERTRKKELKQEIDSLKDELLDAVQAKKEAEKLVSSIERDLERAIVSPSKPKKSSSFAPAARESDPSILQSVLDPDAPQENQTSSSTSISIRSSKATATAAEKAEDDHSVATIVMAQRDRLRDRLRARCEALEAERDSFKRELQIQVQASESLKTDNTKLYEKVRYLQSYNKAPGSRGLRADRDLDLEALEQRYEASVDPFRQFSKAERQRKLNEMTPVERTVFIVAKTFLATKEMRTALFVYVIAMHSLVFITTYHWSHTEGCHNYDKEHLSHLPPAIPEHLKDEVAAKLAAAAAKSADG